MKNHAMTGIELQEKISIKKTEVRGETVVYHVDMQKHEKLLKLLELPSYFLATDILYFDTKQIALIHSFKTIMELNK